MKHLFTFLLVIFLIPITSFSQNLVPNPSFETHTTCNSAITSVSSWNNPSGATPDYYHACNPSILGLGFSVPSNILGWQNARTGDAYVGVIAYEDVPLFGPCPNPILASGWREYVQVQLTSALVSGQTYCVEFYVSMANNVSYATDDLGIYLSSSVVAYPDSNAMPFIPQVVNTTGNLNDTLNWVQVSGSYTASGGEQYIVIGNFKNDANTTVTCENATSFNSFAYYYIDDVFVGLGNCQLPCAMTASFNATNPGCQPNSAMLTAIPSGGTGPFSYLWSNNDTTQTIIGIGPGMHTVTISDSSGCSVTDSFNMPTPSPPVADAGADVTICEGDMTTLTASGGGSYSWNNGPITASQNVSPIMSTNYFVTVSDTFGCTNVDSAFVTVWAAPVVSLNLPNLIFCLSDPNDTLDTALPIGGTWNGSGVSNNHFDPGTAGVGLHWLSYTAFSDVGCRATDSVEVEVKICTGIAELSENGFTLYPNPGTDHFMLAFGEVQQGGTVELFSLHGQIILRQQFETGMEFRVNVGDIAKGIYLVKVMTEDGVFVGRWMK